MNRYKITQKLGYLLESHIAEKFAEAVKEFLQLRYLLNKILDIQNPSKDITILKRWEWIINTPIEKDL